MSQVTLDIKMRYRRNPLTDDIELLLMIPQRLTRTDGEFKWRVIQAITLALTDKESHYGGADTKEGMEALEKELTK